MSAIGTARLPSKAWGGPFAARFSPIWAKAAQFSQIPADELRIAATTGRMQRAWVWGFVVLGGCYGGLAEPDASSGSTGPAPTQVDEADGSTSGAPAASTSGAESSTGADIPSSSTTSTTSTTSGAVESTDGSSSSGGDVESESGESSTGAPLEGCAAQDDALLCEDFEDGIDPEIWQVEENATASVTVEDGAMRVNLGSSDGAHGFIDLQPGVVFPVPNNHLFGRVRILIEPEVPMSHSHIIGATGSLDGAPARYRLDVNGGRLNSRYTHNPSVEQHGGWRKLGRDAPSQVWTCLEWEYDGSTNSMRYWFDGELDVEMEIDGTVEDPAWVAPTFDDLEIGFHTYQAAPNGDDFDIWFDDLVLASERVGC